MDFLLGVLGGMGPEAAVEFLRRLIRFTPAETDQEHIPVLLLNDPRIPDRTCSLKGEGETPLPFLVDRATILENAGCDLIVMPCNTAHSWLPEIRRRVKTPFLDIVEATVEQALRAAPGAVAGVMASDGTLRSGLYQKALERKGARFILPSPDTQKNVMEIIYGVKRTGATFRLRKLLISVMEELQNRGAGVLVAGCTELPLALPPDPPVPVADSLSAPARKVVEILRDRGLIG